MQTSHVEYYIFTVCKLVYTIFYTFTKSFVFNFVFVYIYLYLYRERQRFDILTSICTTIMKKKETFTDLPVDFCLLYYKCISIKIYLCTKSLCLFSVSNWSVSVFSNFLFHPALSVFTRVQLLLHTPVCIHISHQPFWSKVYTGLWHLNFDLWPSHPCCLRLWQATSPPPLKVFSGLGHFLRQCFKCNTWLVLGLPQQGESKTFEKGKQETNKNNSQKGGHCSMWSPGEKDTLEWFTFRIGLIVGTLFRYVWKVISLNKTQILLCTMQNTTSYIFDFLCTFLIIIITFNIYDGPC